MFDFINLDDIDSEGAPQEWQRWRGAPEWRRAPEEELAVLEDEREEQFAAPDEDAYVYAKLDIPNLPEEDNFDPIGLIDDTMDAIEDRMASYNGQVILNYVAGAFEEYLMIEREREERKAYLDSLLQERLAILEASGKKPSSDFHQKESDMMKQFDRKKFNWREITSPLVGTIHPYDGGAFAESMLTNSDRTFKALTRLGAGAAMPASALVQILCSVGNVARPMPGRIGRNAEWHLALTDVYFPTCFIVDDGQEVFKGIIEGHGPPTLVHCAVMTISKEAGGLEAKGLLENIKLTTDLNRPRRRAGLSVGGPYA